MRFRSWADTTKTTEKLHANSARTQRGLHELHASTAAATHRADNLRFPEFLEIHAFQGVKHEVPVGFSFPRETERNGGHALDAWQG